MLNDEIQRLIRCIIETSIKSNVTFEEIQNELAQQFEKEMASQTAIEIPLNIEDKLEPQFYEDTTSLCQVLDAETFRKKAETFLYKTCRLSRRFKKEHAVELFCIFHELKQNTLPGELVNRKTLIERFTQACHITEGSAKQYFTITSMGLKKYLYNVQGISLQERVSINLVLDTVYPYVLEL